MPPRHRRRPQATLRRLLATLPLLTPALTLADPTPATWLGSTGLWSDPANWSTNPLYPNNNTPADATYAATLASGTATLDSHITLSDLTLSGGTLAGDNSLTVLNAFTWSSGAFQGAGTLNLQGDSTLSGYLPDLGVWNVINSGTLLYKHTRFQNSLNGTGSICNTGTFRIATDSSSAPVIQQIRVPLNNSGLLDIASNVALTIQHGAGGGIFQIANKSTLSLRDYTLTDGALITGAGSAGLSGSINGHIRVSSKLALSSVIAGTGHVHALNGGTIQWGDTALPENLTLSADVGSTLEIYWPLNSFTTRTLNGSIRNAGTLLLNPQSVNFAITGAGAIDNSGTLRLSTSNFAKTITLQVPLHNSGVVEIQADRMLDIRGGGTSTGAFRVTEPTDFMLKPPPLRFASDYTFGEGTTFSGTGDSVLADGVFTLAGNITVNGRLVLNGSNADSPASFVGQGDIRIANGGTLSWGSFALRHSGDINIDPGGALWLNFNPVGDLGNRTINNAGLFIFEDYNAERLIGSGAIINTGVLRTYRSKPGLPAIEVPLFNSGIFEVGGPQAAIRGGGSASGTFKTSSSWSNLYLESSYSLTNGATFTGSGPVWLKAAPTNTLSIAGLVAADSNVIVQSGTLHLAPNATFRSSKTFTQTGGLLAGAGTLHIAAGSATLANQDWSPGAKLLLSAGSATLNADAGSPDHLALAIEATAGSLTFNTSQHLASLSLTNATAQLAPGANKTLVTQTLSLADSATLDLTDNALRILSPDLPQIQAALLSAYHNGLWDRPGLTTSATTPHHTLAPLLQPDGSLLIQYALTGDLNLDGQINLNDYFTLDSHYLNQSPDSPKTYPQGDLNYDGLINLSDYFLMDSAYLNQTSPLALFPTSPLASSLPEPSSLLLLLPTLLLGRRARSRSPQ